MIKLVTLITLFIITNFNPLFSQESCARIALINHQEIVVDTGPRFKGEGLRFYLEKDEKAIELLNQYQKKQRVEPWLSTLSTSGSLLILVGMSQSDETNSSRLIATGLFMAVVSILFTKTVLYNSEKLLQKSVEEYNKVNYPKIYFSPFNKEFEGGGVNVGISMEY